jgi:hypothetical protein
MVKCYDHANPLIELISPKDAQPPKSLSSENNPDRFPTSQLTRSLAATITRVQLRKTENARPMDCPHHGSDRGVIPRLLDAVGVCSLTYLDMSIQQQEPALSMMLSLYVTLGVFLLLALNPSAHRSLIAFTDLALRMRIP